MVRINTQVQLAMNISNSEKKIRDFSQKPDSFANPSRYSNGYSESGKENDEKSNSPFPSLRKRAAIERADEIVDRLEDMILNPDRADGTTGMKYQDWATAARHEIIKAIQEAETSAAFREFLSANRIGGLCVRVGLLLLATVSSLAAFWFGILFIWREYGMTWGLGATLSTIGLSIAFTTAGLLYGGEGKEQAKREAINRYERNEPEN